MTILMQLNHPLRKTSARVFMKIYILYKSLHNNFLVLVQGYFHFNHVPDNSCLKLHVMHLGFCRPLLPELTSTPCNLRILVIFWVFRNFRFLSDEKCMAKAYYCHRPNKRPLIKYKVKFEEFYAKLCMVWSEVLNK